MRSDRSEVLSNIELQITNYRCFALPTVVHFDLGQRVTAFIGPNNAGKSSLLKFFYEFRSLFAMPFLVENANVSPGRPTLSFQKEVSDPEELFSNENQLDIQIIVSTVTALPVEQSDYSPVTAQAPLPATAIRFTINRTDYRVQSELMAGGAWSGGPFRSYKDGLLLHHADERFAIDARAVFAACRLLSDSVYIPSFRNLVNVGANESYYDLLTGDAFTRDFSVSVAGGSRQKADAVASLIKSIEEIFKIERLELVVSPDQRSLQAFINRKPFKLTELGSGIAQFIMVLYQAKVRMPALILIDEPETGLHPSLQIDFLTTLAASARFSTLFTTHSVGLARSGADKIYTVFRNDFRSYIKDFDDVPNLTEFLGEMSYSGNTDLGYRKVLLVEGPTEIKTMQQILRKLRRDHEITLIPLGGSSLINARAARALAEIRRVSNNVYAIIDSEKKTDTAPLAKDRTGFLRVCKRLGIKFHVLSRRSLENYFSTSAIKQTQLQIRGNPTFDSFDLPPEGWSKALNWRTVRAMEWNEISSTDLGAFISEMVAAPIR